MPKIVGSILTLMMGALLGLVATRIAIRGEPPFGGVRSGAWTAWPGAGSAEADPYARAVFARDGRIPLAAAAGLRFLATTDDTGQALARGCSYTIGGPTPPAQFWTLTLLDAAGFVAGVPSVRLGFTSTEVVRSIDGGFVISIAADARPGNWLPSAGEGRFMAMLSFYDSPVGAALLTGTPAPALPAITRTACPG